MGQLTCSEIRDMLADFSTGALGRRRGRQVKAHLHACPDCSRELRVLIGAAELLKEMPEADPPDGMWEGVLKAIAYVEPRPAPRRLALAPALGLAAAGAAVGVGVYFKPTLTVQEGVALGLGGAVIGGALGDAAGRAVANWEPSKPKADKKEG